MSLAGFRVFGTVGARGVNHSINSLGAPEKLGLIESSRLPAVALVSAHGGEADAGVCLLHGTGPLDVQQRRRELHVKRAKCANFANHVEGDPGVPRSRADPRAGLRKPDSEAAVDASSSGKPSFEESFVI